MHIKIIIVLVVIIAYSWSGVFADETSTVNDILFASESLFRSIKEKNYSGIWSLLSEKSKSVIQQDVYQAYLKAGNEIPRDMISLQFQVGELIAREYWDAYSENFNSSMILDESRWEMGPVGEKKAEIIITYKKSAQPVRLKMFNENNGWKVGLVETFWRRNFLF